MAQVSALTLGDRLRERIEAKGPLPFADWMEACLYDPEGGFYRRADHPAGTGSGSHFATSPTLHPFFARCVAAEAAAAWQDAGRPATWTVAEFGAGDGSLARDALADLRARKVPARWVAIDVRAADATAADRADRAGPNAPAGVAGLEWSAAAPDRFDVAVANEFLDALPFDLHEWRAPKGGQAGWRRVGVGLGAGGRFAWADLGESRVRLQPAAEAGQRRVVMPAVPLWLDAVARAGARLALVADYGAEGPAGDVRAYRGHDHADPLDEPGTADLTGDVDFARLAALAEGLGLRCAVETQEAFLLRHGVLDALNASDRTTVEGASSYLRLRQLLLPTGLGAAFKVARLTRDSAR